MDALVTRLNAYAETSAVAVLLTSDRGAVRAVAKGARRIANGFRGPLDKCVLYRVRLGRRRDGGLHQLHASTVRESFARLRTDPRRFVAASLVLEVSGDLMREDEPHEELFRLAVFTLKVLDTAPPERLGLAATLFLARAVHLSGHAPEIDRCVECGGVVGPGVRPLLAPQRGGILHPDCGRGEPGARGVTLGLLDLLRLFLARPASEVLALDADPADLRALRIVLVDWLEQVLERRFRAAGAAEREFASRPG